MSEPVPDLTRTSSLLDGRTHGTRSGPLPPGTCLGPYRIEHLIAAGGNARVYRASDPTLARPVALKVLDATSLHDSRERFLREVQLVAGLSHPHIVSLYTAGDDRGLAYAAMELLPGTLADEIHRRGRLPWAEALTAIHHACLGLDAARQRGIVHRDVKPSNLLRDAAGAVKVGDFGLAKDLSSALDLTLEGVILGTPLYVSPEQGCGRAADHRSDLYSLGATLFHLLAGRAPFQASTPFELIVRHSVEPPPALPDDIPAAVSSLVRRLLAKDPANRPQTYDEAIDLLARAMNAGDVATVVPPAAAARKSGGDALAISQLAAARAAMDLGRTGRAREMLVRLHRDRGTAWADAGLELAALLEGTGEFPAARAVLESIAASSDDADIRVRALWTLGTLAEKESDAAIQRAIDIYGRVLEVSGTLFPKTLLDARIGKLKAKTRAGSS